MNPMQTVAMKVKKEEKKIKDRLIISPAATHS